MSITTLVCMLVAGSSAAAMATPSLADRTPSKRPDRDARVELAEVASRVDPNEVHVHDVPGRVRARFERSMERVDWSNEGFRGHYLLSAAVTHLGSVSEGGALTARCTLSVTLRHRDGRILAIVQGRATAEGGKSRAAVERDALYGAVGGALEAVPKAIRRAQE